MKLIDSYLNMLNEQYSSSIAVSHIHGQFQNDWTDCFNTKCMRETEDKYAKRYCKVECMISAAQKAITRVNAETSKCSGSTDPNRCLKSLKSAVKRYQDKIANARDQQDEISSREAAFRRNAVGV